MLHRHSSSRWVVCLGLLAVSACGGARSSAPAASAGTAESEARAPVDTLVVSGLRGTLTQHEIQSALEPRMPRFLRCVERRLAELEVLSGTVSLAFHVALDGRVVAVTPHASTLGDRDTERCILEVAAATRFPPPHGGEADLTWPLEVPIDPDVRAPVELGSEAAQALVASAGGTLRAECGGAPLVVTAYVDPDGRVLAAGAAAPDGATSSELDCATAGVRTWRFASPGSYLGKVSFTFP